MTSSALATAHPATAPVSFVPSRSGLVAAFLAGRNERTLAAYRADLEDFRSFAGAATAGEAANRLLAGSHGEANGAALAYKAHMADRGLQAATINRRLAALRSLVKLANTLGMVPWTLQVENVRGQAYRDTRGPGRDGFRRVLGAVQAQSGPKALRDEVIVRLLHDLGLRRGEVVRLDVSDLDLAGDRLFVLGKGRSQKEPLTVPAPTKAALEAWLAVRGSAPGPLFTNFDRAGKGGRLTGSAVYAIVGALGTKAGLAVRPHGLRHLAITTALDLTKGDVRSVQRFSRHKDVRVLNAYDDNRLDLAGDVARLVAGA